MFANHVNFCGVLLRICYKTEFHYFISDSEGEEADTSRVALSEWIWIIGNTRRQPHPPSPGFVMIKGGYQNGFGELREFPNFFGKEEYTPISRKKSRNSQKSPKTDLAYRAYREFVSST